jgi:hypothetical protein
MVDTTCRNSLHVLLLVPLRLPSCLDHTAYMADSCRIRHRLAHGYHGLARTNHPLSLGHAHLGSRTQ